ncbi:TPM domain-containing protein [Winogradskyella alexanderae]|uniref:TPM domain-containing protein n=1 Tax=Winogradskyella alexanderae TaxID=2877123 RepID=A0ABS7XSC2_9FLAO|nr:TPM domain-containing protein [Winogradskyella alexanderae]MCA0132910.1 TPM domain-containing protein [Winogradskyella alexanderae]
MSHLEDFLTSDEESEIVDAIRIAERTTSGEIRVHIEQNYNGDIYNHALEVFHYLKMDNTLERNGVLIYVAVDNKTFVICGDKGINDKVGTDFWNSTRDKIQKHFKNGYFKKGLISGIKEAGDVLSAYFPWDHGDKNELDNTISKG